jgi:hypothetical protein
LHQGRIFTDDLADNACSVNPKTTTAKPRDPIWRPARTSTRGAIATVHHQGTFWALAIPSCVLDFVFRQIARWRSTSWFLPTKVGLGVQAKVPSAIRACCMNVLAPVVGCNPHHLLNQCAQRLRCLVVRLGCGPCPLFTNHPCLYIITPSPATPSDLPGLQTTVVVQPSLFSLVQLFDASSLTYCNSHYTGRAEPFCMQLAIPHMN